MAAELQVVIIYAVTNGYLDDVEVYDVSRFEKEFLDYMKSSQKKILDEIKTSGKLEEETVNSLQSAIKEFKKRFVHSDKK